MSVALTHCVKKTSLVVVCDCDYSECLYVDGQRSNKTGEPTVYAGEIVDAADGRLATLRYERIDFVHDEWPDRLGDALKQ